MSKCLKEKRRNGVLRMLLGMVEKIAEARELRRKAIEKQGKREGEGGCDPRRKIGGEGRRSSGGETGGSGDGMSKEQAIIAEQHGRLSAEEDERDREGAGVGVSRGRAEKGDHELDGLRIIARFECSVERLEDVMGRIFKRSCRWAT